MMLAMDLLLIVVGICALIGIAHYGNAEANRHLEAQKRKQHRRRRNQPARRGNR